MTVLLILSQIGEKGKEGLQSRPPSLYLFAKVLSLGLLTALPLSPVSLILKFAIGQESTKKIEEGKVQ